MNNAREIEPKTYTITLPVIECRNCGERTWMGVSVLGAVGNYCEECAETVAILARMHSDTQMAKMWRDRIIRIPTVPYDPKGETP